MEEYKQDIKLKKKLLHDVLSLKQKSFCEHYVTTNNALKSCVLAGYSDNKNSLYATSWRLLRNPDVAEYIKSIRSELATKHALSRDRVIEEIKKGILMAQDKGDLTNYNKGWDLISKLMGHYEKEQTKSIQGQKIQINFGIKSDDNNLGAESQNIESIEITQISQGENIGAVDETSEPN